MHWKQYGVSATAKGLNEQRDCLDNAVEKDYKLAMKRNLDIALIKRMVNKRGLCYTGNGAYTSFQNKLEETVSRQIFNIIGDV